MMQGLQEQARALAQKRAELAELFAKHRQGDAYDMPVEVIEQVNARNDELEKLGLAYAETRKLETIQEKNAEALAAVNAIVRPRFSGGAETGGPKPEQKSIGQMFVESVAFKGYRNGNSPVAEYSDYDLKTLFQTTAGWSPETTRTGRLVPLAVERIAVVDLIPKTETNQAAVVYMEETTLTNNAAEVAEAGTMAEAALVTTERTSTVRKIGVTLPVTDEQFADEPRTRDYVNNRLVYMLNARLDQQLLTGDGIAPNLTGILNVSGINSQAKGADPTPDAIFKGMILVNRLGFTDATGIILHPNDWQDIRLLRTADGIYIWGNPSDRGATTIFGLPVVVTTYETENTALLGDFAQFSELALRTGIALDVTNSDDTDFQKGRVRVRATFRAAFIVYRAKAFAKVTGI